MAADRSSDGSPSLRVGVLLDSWEVAAWIDKILSEVRHAPHAELTAVIKNTSAASRGGPLARLWQRRAFWLYELYARLDRRLLRVEPDAFRRVNIRDSVGGCAVIEVQPIQSRYSDYFPDRDLAAIHDLKLDVALRFGFRILRGEALGIARFGVWSYHHDDNDRIRGGPPCFWEVIDEHPNTGSMLQILDERLDGGQILARSWAPTHRRSVARNKSHVYWKSSAFVGRKLRQLHERGAGSLAEPETTQHQVYSNRLYRKPRNSELLPPLWRFVWRSLGSRLSDALSRNQWFLAYRRRSHPEPGGEELFRFHCLFPPPDRFWADPFPLQDGDRDLVFFEEYLYARRRGHISVTVIDADGEASSPRPVLERPYHLSYPFTFRLKDELFMIPESAENRTVELYRCNRFPDEWALEAVLMERVRAVDATLHQVDGRWWMFVNLADEEAAHCHDELHLFSASSPLGPWSPHPNNPIVSDARRARPAGKLFRHRGALLRPAQECSRRYGYAVRIQRIKRLSQTEYEEEPLSSILPHWRPEVIATHTLNHTDRLTVVDGLRRIRRSPLRSGQRPRRPRRPTAR